MYIIEQTLECLAKKMILVAIESMDGYFARHGTVFSSCHLHETRCQTLAVLSADWTSASESDVALLDSDSAVQLLAFCDTPLLRPIANATSAPLHSENERKRHDHLD